MDRQNQTSTERGGRIKALAALLPLVLAFAGFVSPAAAASGSAFPLTVSVGQSLVLETPNEVSTVSIADPRVADAAVGSQRTVVVNGKASGITSLVVWEEGGKYTLYQVTCSDTRKKQQVLLKVKVSEVLTDKMKELGLDWQGSLSSAKALDGTLRAGLFTTKVGFRFGAFHDDASHPRAERLGPHACEPEPGLHERRLGDVPRRRRVPCAGSALRGG